MKGKHTKLKPAKETEAELKPAEVIKDELSERSDTNLELNELSDAQEGAGSDAVSLLKTIQTYSINHQVQNRSNLFQTIRSSFKVSEIK
ncbi:hypothetical protein YC2023_004802 [Brassica napus]